MSPEALNAIRTHAECFHKGVTLVLCDEVERLQKSVAEAKELIKYIGTTGTERTDVIRRADDWLKTYDF